MTRTTTKTPLKYTVLATALLAVAAVHAETPATDPADAAEAAALQEEIAKGVADLVVLARRLAAEPGPPLSDLALSLLTGDAPVAAPGEAPVDDATAAALRLAARRTLTDDELARAEQALLARAADNAYYAVVLIDHGHFGRRDPALVEQALRAGASAPVYRPPYTALIDELVSRTPSDAGSAESHPAMRALGVADFFAALATGPVASLYGLCRDAVAERRADCDRLAERIHADAPTFSEALAAAAILDRYVARTSPLGPRQTALRWVMAESRTLLADEARFTSADAERFAARWRRDGELAARRDLLAQKGIAATPPADWRFVPPAN